MNFVDFGMDTASLAGSLEGRLAAVRDAGFPQVTVSATDIVGHPAGTAAGIRAVRASGLRVTAFEALRDFEGLSGRLHLYKVEIAKSMLDLCSRTGGRLLVVEASTSTHADSDPEVIARDLRKLAMLAVPLGVRIAFKPLSWGRTVRTLASAADVVFRADVPNLGVAIDSFDVLSAEESMNELDALDASQIFLVQLSDYVWTELRSAAERARTATHFRVFPGEGAHSERVAMLVTRLSAMGYLGDYSFDVYNDDYLQMPPEAVAERARRAAEWLGETVLRRSLPVPNIERLQQSRRA
jgi:sugar phosphate isomerase/epimerase